MVYFFVKAKSQKLSAQKTKKINETNAKKGKEERIEKIANEL